MPSEREREGDVDYLWFIFIYIFTPELRWVRCLLGLLTRCWHLLLIVEWGEERRGEETWASNKLPNTHWRRGVLFINTQICLVVKYLERFTELTACLTPAHCSYLVYYIIISLTALFCPLQVRPSHAQPGPGGEHFNGTKFDPLTSFSAAPRNDSHSWV